MIWPVYVSIRWLCICIREFIMSIFFLLELRCRRAATFIEPEWKSDTECWTIIERERSAWESFNIFNVCWSIRISKKRINFFWEELNWFGVFEWKIFDIQWTNSKIGQKIKTKNVVQKDKWKITWLSIKHIQWISEWNLVLRNQI